jgi:hypothetical protein
MTDEKTNFFENFFEKNVYKVLKIFLVYSMILTILTISVTLLIVNKINPLINQFYN